MILHIPLKEKNPCGAVVVKLAEVLPFSSERQYWFRLRLSGAE